MQRVTCSSTPSSIVGKQHRKYATALFRILLSFTFTFAIKVAPVKADRLDIAAKAGDTALFQGNTFPLEHFILRSGSRSLPVIGDDGRIAVHARLSSQPLQSQDTVLRIDPNGSKSILAKTGTSFEGTAGTYSSFGSLTINDFGQIVYSAGLSGTGVTTSNDTALIHHDGNISRVLAREGDLAPGTSGHFTAFSNFSYSLGALGNWFGFRSTLSGLTAPNNVALYSLRNNSILQFIVSQGQNAPGLTAETISNPQLAQNRYGDAILYSSLAGQGITAANGQALWSVAGDGHLSLLVRGSLFTTSATPIIGTSGMIIFSGTPLNEQAGIWLSHGGGISPLIKVGDPTPPFGYQMETFAGTTGAVGNRTFWSCADDGLIFSALLTGPDTHSGNNNAVFQSRLRLDGTRELLPILRGGMQVPGEEEGTKITNASQVTYVNDNCEAYFYVQLQGVNMPLGTGSALLRWSGGRLTTVLRNRDPIPGFGDDVFYQPGNTAPSIYMNNRGQALVYGGLTNLTTGLVTTRSLWRVDEYGHPRGIGFESSFGTLTYSDGSHHTATAVLISSSALNDQGEFAFYAELVEQGGGVAILRGRIEADTQCRADLNHDASATVQDLFLFLERWFAQDPAADIDDSNDITVQDLFTYLTIYFEGC